MALVVPSPKNNPARSLSGKKIDRATPAVAHSYQAAHPEQTFMQQLFGYGARAEDFSRARQQYNKKIYDPGKRELKYQQRAGWRDFERRKEREEHEVYRRTRQLEEAAARETNPRRLERLQGELRREQERADHTFERFVETQERTLERQFRSAEKQLHRERDRALRQFRQDINEKIGDDEDSLPENFGEKLA